MSSNVKGQPATAVSFNAVTGSDILFDFNTVQKYITGIKYMNAATLNIISDGRFDIYVSATTSTWTETSIYSSSGDIPPIGIVELQFRNINSTSLVSGFVPLQDTPKYIIGTVASDASIYCPNKGTNEAGSYLSDHSCYTFAVDLKIVPGFDYKSGLYQLTIEYKIISDL